MWSHYRHPLIHDIHEETGDNCFINSSELPLAISHCLCLERRLNTELQLIRIWHSPEKCWSATISHELQHQTQQCRLPKAFIPFRERLKKHLQVLVEEVQQDAISIHVVLLDVLVLEVTTVSHIRILILSQPLISNSPSSHKAVNLVIVPLDNVLGLDAFLPLLHGFLVLVLAGQHGNRNADTRSIVGVDHGRVTGGCGLEDSVLLRRQVHNLAAPAEAHDGPGLDVLVLALDLVNDFGDAADGLGGCASGLEEFAEAFAFFLL